MENSLKEILDNPIVGKIAFLVLGIGVIWFIIRLIKRNLFSKIKENNNRYKAGKFGSFVGYFLTILLITIAFNDKLGSRAFRLECYDKK